VETSGANPQAEVIVDATQREVVLLLREVSVASNRTAAVFGETHDLHRTDLDALAVVVGASTGGVQMTPAALGPGEPD
jgi:hypothetical protein